MEFSVERDWWKRASVISTLPKPIAHEFLETKKKFGSDIANLILLLYNSYGPAVAKRLYNNIIVKEDLNEVLKEVEKQLDKFDARSRRILSNYILSIEYTSSIELIQEISRNYEKEYPGLLMKSISVFQELFKRGLYFSPNCIVAYTIRKYYNGVASQIKCQRSVLDNIEKYLKATKL